MTPQLAFQPFRGFSPHHDLWLFNFLPLSQVFSHHHQDIKFVAAVHRASLNKTPKTAK
jgi:hypothetical protein